MWGDTTNRFFEEIKDKNIKTNYFETGIQPLQRQPKDLIDGCLPRAFEDAIIFTRRLGECYLWIDCLCIPQDQAAIQALPISQMDQIYSESICTLVSLISGVQKGPHLEWVAPNDSGPLGGGYEPDACLLIVGVTAHGLVTRRLGVAYVRMEDFLVAGAEVKEKLLE